MHVPSLYFEFFLQPDTQDMRLICDVLLRSTDGSVAGARATGVMSAKVRISRRRHHSLHWPILRSVSSSSRRATLNGNNKSKSIDNGSGSTLLSSSSTRPSRRGMCSAASSEEASLAVTQASTQLLQILQSGDEIDELAVDQLTAS